MSYLSPGWRSWAPQLRGLCGQVLREVFSKIFAHTAEKNKAVPRRVLLLHRTCARSPEAAETPTFDNVAWLRSG